MRALAILPVVMFHAKVPGFSGGFVGVDVFFVISGYLITSIIFEDIRAERFSITQFYERRARRILPAFFLVMFASCVLAALLLFPKQYLAFSRSLVAAALFGSSITFYGESGYFDLAAEMKPLLHTWSLSVEELYYIFFPVLMLGLARFFPGRYWQSLMLIAAASLAGSVAALIDDGKSNAAFYLPHLRAWELLVGAVLAVGRPADVGSGPVRHGVSLAGLAMIVVPIFTYSDATTFPGLMALPPCLGTALLLYSGQKGPAVGNRILSFPAFVFVGLVSYSLYLWHWPLLVFARYFFGRDLAAGQTVSVVGLSIALAVVSTFFIEKLFRGQDSKLTSRQIWAFSIAGTVILIAIGVHGDVSKGWPGRYSAKHAAIFNAARDRDPRQKECLHVRPNPRACLYGNGTAEAKVALWGDSHAAVYADVLGRVASEKQQSIRVYTFPSCPPVRNWARIGQSWRKACLDFQTRVFDELRASQSITRVIIAARYRGYPFAKKGSGFAAAFEETMVALTRAGKSVAIIYPVDEWHEDVPAALGRRVTRGDLPGKLSRPYAMFARRNSATFGFLDTVAGRWHLDKIEPHRLLCDSGKCYFYRNGQVYYSDAHHLSLTGARRIAPLFRPLFK